MGGGVLGGRYVPADVTGKPQGGMFDDVMRHAKLWAEKQTSAAERREAKRKVRKGATRLGCSERVKTVVRQHSQSSGELIGSIHGMKYVKYR